MYIDGYKYIFVNICCGIQWLYKAARYIPQKLYDSVVEQVYLS